MGILLDVYRQSLIEYLARNNAAPPVAIEDLRATLNNLAAMGMDLPHVFPGHPAEHRVFQGAS